MYLYYDLCSKNSWLNYSGYLNIILEENCVTIFVSTLDYCIYSILFKKFVELLI